MDDGALQELKKGLEAVWSAGDYSFVAKGLEASSQAFLQRHAIADGERVLDLACGTGQLAIPAARAGAAVTGLDLSEPWIEQAKARAAAENLNIHFKVGDAEALPFDDGAFDLVISLIGVMFAPRPERAAAEMLRVCRSGGRIVLGNWTAEGFVGDFFGTVAKHAPPPDMPSPLLWGDEASVRQRLSPGSADISLQRMMLHFDYPLPPEAVVDHYLAHFGPTKLVAEALDGDARHALRKDLIALFEAANTATDGTTQTPAEILEVVATRA
ncbi:MAG: class I SAM-dependent methyltransferase [Pseudomonadota bacterium]